MKIIQLHKRGIVHVVYHKGTMVTTENTINEFQIVRELTVGHRTPILIDLRNLKALCRESRKYYAGCEATKLVSAAALIIGSQASRILGSIFIGLNKPEMPLEPFTSEEEAFQWLEGFISKEKSPDE